MFDSVSSKILLKIIGFEKNVKNLSVNNFVRLINKECKENLKKISEYNTFVKNKKYEIIKKENNRDIILSLNGKNKIHIHKKLYLKMKSQLIKKCDFDTLVYCIILRYKSIYNYDTMHLAVPQHIYDNISKEHKNVIELFGSVMNKSFKNYCGLFYDLEKYFGNIGNFFDIKIKSGAYVCNPPYEIDIITNAYEKLLQSIDKSKQNITIYNVLPVWNKKYGYNILQKCEYKKIKNYDINNYYKEIFSSKYLVYHRVYCKKNFPFYHYLENRYINATHCHFFVLSNDKSFKKNKLNKILQKYKYAYQM